MHSMTYALIHLLIHSTIHPSINPFIQPAIHSFNHPFIRLSINPLGYTSIHPSTHPSRHSFIYPLTHLSRVEVIRRSGVNHYFFSFAMYLINLLIACYSLDKSSWGELGRTASVVGDIDSEEEGFGVQIPVMVPCRPLYITSCLTHTHRSSSIRLFCVSPTFSVYMYIILYDVS